MLEEARVDKLDKKEIKLHIGCGTVYLEGYVNIHPAPDGIACFCPEEVEINKTTVDKYYKTGFDERPKKHIADLVSTLDELPNKIGFIPGETEMQVDEICMFHVLEHIPLYDLHKSLEKISLILKPGGRFRVAVPDFDGIVLEYAEKLKEGISEEEKEWYFRFVHGTQKDKYSHHYCGYNRHRLVELLKSFGFDRFEDLPNQNFYPAIHLMAYKEYAKPLIHKNFNLTDYVILNNAKFVGDFVIGDNSIIVREDGSIDINTNGKDLKINGKIIS